jgi:hypothetical protein
MDAERDATLAYLDRVTRQMGGRRGEAAVATPTGGLIYAHTRHATSRAGDPCPHDHVLVANLVEMADERGGWKAADTALWREHLHAATMVGRVAAARVAVELGYGIEADPGPVGEARTLAHRRRARRGDGGALQAGGGDRRRVRPAGRVVLPGPGGGGPHHPPGQGGPGRGGPGGPVAGRAGRDRLAGRAPGRAVDAAARGDGPRPASDPGAGPGDPVRNPGTDGDLARRKVFCRRDVIVAVAPHLYGQDPVLLEALVDRALADPEVIPLVGVAGAREQAHSLASVIARETAIAESLSRQVDRGDAPATPNRRGGPAAIGRSRPAWAVALSAEQATAAVAICTSGRGAEIVVGVAGAGKTTMLRVVAAAFEPPATR